MAAYVLAVSLGAFLLFQVQPIMGRHVLPWFGGSPAVWSTCMLFFQVLLLCGYAYAHGLAARLMPRTQALLHAGVLAAALGLAVLSWVAHGNPIAPAGSLRPPDSSVPALRILLVLVLTVGLPYFVLSATGPLVQSWFARSFPERSPYPLYVLSNAGSLLALVSYPLLVEPGLSLAAQGAAWGAGFAAFAVSIGVCCWRLFQDKGSPALRHRQEGTAECDDPSGEAQGEVVGSKKGRGIVWVGLAAAASTMLLATTNQVCQEVAVIPFLWVLPLTIYLLSFVVVFAGERWYSRRWWLCILLAGSVGIVIALFDHLSLNIFVELGIYSVALAAVCMVCHGELFRLRPEPSRLTSFYLAMAFGGALGGAFVSLLAPMIFLGFWELHVGLVSVWLLVAAVLHVDKGDWINGPRVRALKYIALCVAGALAVPLLVEAVDRNEDAIHCSRNFYGVLRVREGLGADPGFESLRLSHGAILHGFQFQSEERRSMPMSYYSEGSGVGLAVLFHPKRLDGAEGMHIGCIGLGVGTMAAYGRSIDRVRFYEINQDVIDLSSGPAPYFTYLGDCPGNVDVVYGDARVKLEQERSAGRLQAFDVLAVDAFSSDSIPVHLLTLEAVQLYVDHLAWDGVLAIHVSNRHLDLARVVWQIAAYLDVHGISIKAPGDDQGIWGSTWILLSRNDMFFTQAEIADVGDFDPEGGPENLWTDDYSNLLSVLH